MFEPQVYISSADADSEIAFRVQAALNELGVGTLLLGEQSSVHTDLEIEVRSGIRDSYALVALVSKNSIYSSAISDDLAYAQEAGVPILPVSADGTRIPLELTQQHAFVEGPLDVNRIAEILYEMRPMSWTGEGDPTISLPADLTPHETNALLSAIATYWRSCGGIGMPVEFSMEQAEVEEPTYA